MTDQAISLRDLFLAMQEEMVAALTKSRKVILHSGEKGAVTELHWKEMLTTHLPSRYRVRNGRVIDSTGSLSDQIDVIVFDGQYSPLLFEGEETCYVPAESVYAVFEVKQDLNRENVRYAGEKAASVRRLKRTSAPIVHAGGIYPARDPLPILAGILTLDCGWATPFGDPLRDALNDLSAREFLDIGCVLRHGSFQPLRHEDDGETRTDISASDADTALVTFFLGLLTLLQQMGTAPALDLVEYQKALRPV